MNKLDYRGYEQGPDFDRARSQIATPFQYLDIDLTSATANAIYTISGDFLYVDASSTGTATLELNNQYNDPAAPFLIQSGFAINSIFKQVKLSWSAQPGKKIRLMYSTGERVIPANSGLQSVSIIGTPTISGNVTTQEVESYTGAFKASSPLAALTPETVVSPASNVNGLVVVGVEARANNSLGQDISLLAKTSAPSTLIDGDLINVGFHITATSSAECMIKREKPILIGAGKGLYFITSSADNTINVFRSVLYRLL